MFTAGGANSSSRSDLDCEVYIVGVEGGHDERIVISSGPDERIVISSESEGAEPGDGHNDGTCMYVCVVVVNYICTD